ncbi:MarR family winged helix-turn-helix transcriptional regulator [Gudongella sp. DL1XJH-153]|uniref:MarR family winged helix-turn-helix transcriptional regulator n=1 Tax=Gudongella sp. DL1XJH-153 TaxID=3409804 RepID=UPI003BB54B33
MIQKNVQHVDAIEEYLRKVDYIIRKKGRVILSDFNITVPQFTALQILINNGDMTISELSQKMDLACSTITDLIDRMEKTDLVKRKKDEQDKRVVRVEVLQEGHDILARVLEKRIEFLTEKLKGISENDKNTLRVALESLYLEMEEEI